MKSIEKECEYWKKMKDCVKGIGQRGNDKVCGLQTGYWTRWERVKKMKVLLKRKSKELHKIRNAHSACDHTNFSK